MSRKALQVIYLCYFISGALGLVYQILWLRKLLLVFGSTVHAVSTVLTVFFGGLALGSWLFGRWIDRRDGAGLRWYALLEIGIGVYAFLTLPLFDAIRHLYIPVYRASGFSSTVLVAASFVCSALILLVPTTLLGGTFPVLSRFVIRSSEGRAARIAALYGVNTAGAMCGTLAVYFLALPTFGLRLTLLGAGVLNVGLGVLCLWLDRQLRRSSTGSMASEGVPPSTQPAPAMSGALRGLCVAFALSGFSAMVYEVAWTRALSLVLGSSIYAFCIILATFLGGMALGSFVVRRDLQARPATFHAVIVCEAILGLYGLCSIVLFNMLPQWFITLWPLLGRTFAGLTWLQLIVSGSAMLLPTFAMGVLFPLVSDLVTERLSTLGRRLGTIYAVNTLGGILGSFAAGFVLIPRWGLPWAIAVAAMVNVAAALLVILMTDRRTALRAQLGMAAAVLVLFVSVSGWIIVPVWRRQLFAAGVYLTPEAFRNRDVRAVAMGSDLLFYKDGLNTTVSVHRKGEELFLKVGGKTDASNGIDMGTQVLSAHLPLLLHANPHSVAIIGLGSGVTAGSAATHPVTTVQCAEIEPAVIEGAKWFKAYNHDVHHDPRATIYEADGRNFLLASQRQYDVIISEPSNPWMAGVAHLFTREFYRLVAQRLAPGGIMCQWVQIYRIFPSDLKLMLKTFHETFPYVSVWSSVSGDLLLMGSMEPHTVDLATLAQRMQQPQVRESLARVGSDRPELLLELFLLGNTEVESLTSDVSAVHADDRPVIEFHAPKALYNDAAYTENYEGLRRFAGSPSTVVSGYQRPQDAAFYDAVGRMRAIRKEPRFALEAYETSAELNAASIETWLHVAESALDLNRYLNAEQALQRALELDPHDARAQALMGRLQTAYGRPDDAQRAYEASAAARAPEGPLAVEIGDFFRGRQQFRWAAEWYRSAISQRDGVPASTIASFAEASVSAHDWPAVIAAARVGMSNFPWDATFPLVLGRAAAARDLDSQAAAWFAKALTVAPNLPEAYYQLGRIAAARGASREAIRQLRRGLQYDPYHREALQLLHRLQTQ